jgi:hypothetical protein
MISHIIQNCIIRYTDNYKAEDRKYFNDITKYFFNFLNYAPKQELRIFFISQNDYKLIQDDDSYGCYDDDQKTIYINSNQKGIENYARTLLHELYHSYQYYQGLKASIDKEITSFLYDNRWFEISARYYSQIILINYLRVTGKAFKIVLKYKLKLIQKEISDRFFNFPFNSEQKGHRNNIRRIFFYIYFFSNDILNLF